ncbi:AIF_HP2_G0052310.mRNA.1.CDS.1 [Saccharomyces cerevisiae]|nr:AIF_HP2_G0052310.mRNA.1.CDS.1 [Saccharomyces cerevisiae]CAI6797561.1 AIF_HP2_G0052310.mRNA.1.CDS.1 [Saccharomyces cerevisiae]
METYRNRNNNKLKPQTEAPHFFFDQSAQNSTVGSFQGSYDIHDQQMVYDEKLSSEQEEMRKKKKNNE